MARSFANARRTPLGTRPEAPHRRPLIDKDRLHNEAIDVDLIAAELLGIADCRTNQLLDGLAGRFGGVNQGGQSLINRLAANDIGNDTNLTRSYAQIPQPG